MLSDLKYAMRLLLKAPGFSLLTLFTLASGLAFAIYVSAVVKAVVLVDLPWPHFDRLSVVKEFKVGSPSTSSIHYSDYLEYSKAQTSFEALYPTRQSTVSIGGKRYPESFLASNLAAGAWALHGVQPIMGRTLVAADEQSGAAPVMVIGADLWRQHFGADPAIVGSQAKVDGVMTTIVGVMPAGFRFPSAEQIWLPFIAPIKYTPGDSNVVKAIGLLKPGVSTSQASADVNVVAERLATTWPNTNKDHGASVAPFAQFGIQSAAPLYATLGSAAGLLLLLVWINTGNLLLARAGERQQETAVRSALGAPSHRLFRLILCEGLVLAFGACILGLFFAAWALSATDQAFQSVPQFSDMPFWLRFHMTPSSVLVGLVLTVLSTLTISVLPAWRNAKTELMTVLRDGTRHGQGRAAGRLSGALVITQIAVSSMLLVAACVLTYAIHQMLQADYGCRSDGVATARIELTNSALPYQTDAARLQLWQRLDASLRNLPGAPHYAMASELPGDGRQVEADVLPDGFSVTNKQYPSAGVHAVNASFFKGLDIPLVSGRAFSDQDRADTLKVAVVDAQFAERFWPKQSPLGKRIRLNAAKADGQLVTVVGISRNVLQGAPSGGDASQEGNVYVPITQAPPGAVGIALAGSGDMAASLEQLRQTIGAADANLAAIDLLSFDQLHSENVGGLNVMSGLCVALGLISLLLAVSGIYGITSRAVTLRTHEVGVRRAVGATDGAVLRLLFRRSVRQLLIGLPVGLLLGWLVTVVMADFLYRADLAVPAAMFAVSVAIALVILLATLIPARRAIALIPSAALRYQ
ncbi:MAG: ABC transporter permease [Burkholderiales bacterium]|nr:ABC transporter permease [Burkholderiales bacterium]